MVVRTDAQRFHDDIAADRPGPVNRLDPGSPCATTPLPLFEIDVSGFLKGDVSERRGLVVSARSAFRLDQVDSGH